MASEGKSFLDDSESFKALIDRIGQPEKAEYLSYGSLSLESAFPGRKMVIYTLKNSKPLDIDVITFGAFMCDWDLGPSFDVANGNGTLQVVTTPKKFRPRDLFLHIPQHFELKYKGKHQDKAGVDFVSHYAVLVKTRSKEHLQVDGHTYCVTLNKFRERFPDLKFKY
jgi:hypothetical protein